MADVRTLRLSAALTWFTGRSAISGRSLGKDARAAVVVKDVLVGIHTATLLGTLGLGAYVGSGSAGLVPIEEGHVPARETPTDKARALRALRVLSTANLVAMAGIIGVTTFLNQRAASSGKWAALARVLP